VSIDEREVGEGYAVPTEAGLEAIRLLARSEGVLTDPVYTGKALAGLVRDARDGVYSRGDSVIFLHTGGVPSDFAFAEVLSRE
jgi:D-cysteine desulfhydrase